MDLVADPVEEDSVEGLGTYLRGHCRRFARCQGADAVPRREERSQGVLLPDRSPVPALGSGQERWLRARHEGQPLVTCWERTSH